MVDEQVEWDGWRQSEPESKTEPFNHGMCGTRHTVQQGCPSLAERDGPRPLPGQNVTTEPAALCALKDRDGDRWVRWSNDPDDLWPWGLVGGPFRSFADLLAQHGPLEVVADRPAPPDLTALGEVPGGEVLGELVSGGGGLLSDRQAALFAAAHLLAPTSRGLSQEGAERLFAAVRDAAGRFEQHLERDDDPAPAEPWAAPPPADYFCPQLHRRNDPVTNVRCGLLVGHVERQGTDHTGVDPRTGQRVTWPATS